MQTKQLIKNTLVKQKRTIYGFYSNDPLSNDQGGGAEHFRCIYRLLNSKNEDFKLISSKLGDENFNSEKVEYISISPHFGKYYLNLFIQYLNHILILSYLFLFSL